VNTPTRRRWFQVHLSTCVVLMFVAGGVIWANVREQQTIEAKTEIRERGWPLVFHSERRERYFDSFVVLSFTDRSFVRLAADAAIGAGILVASAVLLELLTCRRRPPA